MPTFLRRKKWLFREWDVSTADGMCVVTYSGWGHGCETVYVDGAIVSQIRSIFWYVPKFEFTVRGHAAVIEVAVWPWMTIRRIRLSVAGQLCYAEGYDKNSV